MGVLGGNLKYFLFLRFVLSSGAYYRSKSVIFCDFFLIFVQKVKFLSIKTMTLDVLRT